MNPTTVYSFYQFHPTIVSSVPSWAAVMHSSLRDEMLYTCESSTYACPFRLSSTCFTRLSRSGRPVWAFPGRSPSAAEALCVMEVWLMYQVAQVNTPPRAVYALLIQTNQSLRHVPFTALLLALDELEDHGHLHGASQGSGGQVRAGLGGRGWVDRSVRGEPTYMTARDLHTHTYLL